MTSRYNITFTSITTGTITQTNLTVTAQANTKTYDGGTSSAMKAAITLGSLQGSDTTPAGGWTQTYASKNTGTSLALIPLNSLVVSDGNSGANYNYTFAPANVGTITKTNLTVTAVTDTKTYDGTTNSAVEPTMSAALQTGDTTNSLTQAFATKDVGLGNKTIVPAIVINDGNNNGGNYNVSLVNCTIGTINQAGLTIGADTNTKTYDGTTNAAATPLVAGLQGSDTVTGKAEAYTDKNIGTGKTLVVTAYTVNDGNSGNNYSVSTVSTNTGVINQATLTVSAAGVNRAYNGDTNATVNLSSDKASADDVTTVYTSACFTDGKNIGTNKPVAVAGISVTGGADAGNYTLGNTTASTVANITPATVTVTSGLTADNKVYDGTTSATISSNSVLLAGVIGTEDVSVNTNGYTASFADASAATNKTVTVTNLSLAGADQGNYALAQPVLLTADITPATPTLDLGSTPNPSLYGSSVTFTATVKTNGATAGDATGSVVFKDGATPLSTNDVTGGAASYASAGLSLGSHSLTAEYSGDTNYLGSTSSPALSQVVQAVTVTALDSSANPALPGSSITFTATVRTNGVKADDATGSVVFKDGATPLGTNDVTGGEATCSTSALAHGMHSLTAEYSGENYYLGSTNSPTLFQAVNTPPTTANHTLGTSMNQPAGYPLLKLLAGCTDADGDPLTVSGVSATSTNGGTLLLTSTNALYTPANNYVGADAFTYTVSDGFGGTADGTVFVTVSNGQSFNIATYAYDPGAGTMTLTIAGIPGYTYRVQYTTGLTPPISWTDLSTNTAPANGLWQVVDTVGGNTNRFYRTAYP